MADGDSTTTKVGLCVVEAKFLLDGEELRSESLVNLDEIHLVQSEASSSKSLFSSRDRSDAHDLRFATSGSEGNDSSKRSKVVRLDSFGRGDNDSGSTVLGSTNAPKIWIGFSSDFLEVQIC